MEQNNNSDELIEIKPDAVPEVVDDDRDMKINDKDAAPVVSAAVTIAEAEAASVIENEAATVSEADADTVNEADASTVNEANADTVNESNAETTDESVSAEASYDDFSVELEAMEQEEHELAMLDEIGDSIVEQVDAEIENVILDAQTAQTLANQVSDASEDDDEDRASFWTKIPWWGYTVAGVAIIIIATFVWALASPSGHRAIIRLGSKYAADKVTYAPVQPVERVDVEDEVDISDITNPDLADIEMLPDDYAVITPEFTPAPVIDDANAEDTSQNGAGSSEDPEAPVTAPVYKPVYNILLIGEENMDTGGYRGRTDMLMVASFNMEQNKLKLISIMRDSLVAIPGYLDNRVNVAYAIGGVSLLYETLKANLGIEFDNYILVNFDSFENIVDALGGVDIELTSEEAKYLNTTNYISKPEYRNVVSGKNHVNGNQALGYCRVRNVGTANREYSDFGRTARQRAVMNEIIDKAVGMNALGLAGFAGKCLPYVTTDLTAEQIENYINMILTAGFEGEVENYRIPVKGTFSEARVRDMLVTKIDLEKNAEALRNFIYGP